MIGIEVPRLAREDLETELLGQKPITPLLGGQRLMQKTLRFHGINRQSCRPPSHRESGMISNASPNR
jgi:hypothetical protein